MDKLDKIYSEAVEGINERMLLNPESLEWFNYVNKLPDFQKTVYLIVVLENQVNNGGFDQYFFNLYGQFAFLTISALNRIKAFEKEELLKKVLSIYNPDNLTEIAFAQYLTKRDWMKIHGVNDLYENELNHKYWNSTDNALVLLNNFISQGE